LFNVAVPDLEAAIKDFLRNKTAIGGYIYVNSVAARNDFQSRACCRRCKYPGWRLNGISRINGQGLKWQVNPKAWKP